MSERLPRITPEEMTPEQREVYLRFTEGKRVAAGNAFSLLHPDGGLMGPPNTWLLSPPLARAYEQLGAVMRYELQVPYRAREIALLLHAFHRQCAFELYAHRLAGKDAGLSEEEIEGLATRTPPAFRDDVERIVFDTTLALLDRKTLDDAEYARAVEVLGRRKLFELVSLIGHYDLVATQMLVFGIEPPVR